MKTDYDKRVNDEADEHAEKMQEQRNKHAVNSLLKTMVERGLIKKPKKREVNNEIND